MMVGITAGRRDERVTPPVCLPGRRPLELDLIAAREHDRRPGEQQEAADRFCGQHDISGYIVARAGDRIIGAADILQRTIQFQGQPLLLDGLGGVATLHDWRGRGVAIATTAEAIRLLREAGCQIACLCANIPRLGPLYHRVGFVPLGRPHIDLGRSGACYTDTDGMIAPVADPATFAAVLADAEPFDIGRGNW